MQEKLEKKNLYVEARRKKQILHMSGEKFNHQQWRKWSEQVQN